MKKKLGYSLILVLLCIALIVLMISAGYRICAEMDVVPDVCDMLPEISFGTEDYFGEPAAAERYLEQKKLPVFAKMRSGWAVIVASDFSLVGDLGDKFVYVATDYKTALQGVPEEATNLSLICGENGDTIEEVSIYPASNTEGLYDAVEMCRNKDFFILFYIYEPAFP